jgi:YrbI family 3-deoxy-D-manno-octulosonate 8-phosphate phosphatase
VGEVLIGRATAFIPVRAGSKGIPGKNLLPIGGRPLVDWVIAAAVDCSLIDNVVVSTDGDEIERYVAATWPDVVVHRRSAASATDEASTESVMLEYLEADPRADPFVLVQATSPLTTADDVAAVVRLLDGHDSALSVVRQRRFQWARAADGALPVGFDPRERPRRQDHDGFLVENGALYAASREGLLASGCRVHGSVGLHEMADTSYVELDEPSDVGVIDHLLRDRLSPVPLRPAIFEAARRVRLVIADVDGCLTDNGMYYSTSGAELKRFSARDGKGFELLRLAGVRTMLLTSESSSVVTDRSIKLKVDRVVLGSVDKLADAELVCHELGIGLEEVAFLGDDVHDRALMEAAGLAVCPADATQAAAGVAAYQCRADGGRGAFRELADLICLAIGGRDAEAPPR